MAVINCNECNGAVSTLASACPHCGAPVSQVQTPQHPLPPRVASTSYPPPQHLEHEDLLRLFVGKNYEYYAKKWKLAEQRKGTARKWLGDGSWNWAAFFFAPLWAAYRKIPAYSFVFIIFLVFQLILALGVSLSAAREFNILNIFLAVSYLWGGNHFYKQHVDEKLREITSSGASDEAIRMRFAKEGGTSVGAAVGQAVVMIILMMLIGVFGK
jgi:hypothetical protein